MEPLTLGSAWWSASGVEVDDRLIEWPADVFALTEVVLEQSEAYRFVLSPPAGAEWPPADMADWPQTTRDVAAAWTAWARDRDGAAPELVRTAWAVVRDGVDTPIEDIAEGRAWPLCEALLVLHTVADEACAGMGVAVDDPRETACAVRGRGRELLARTGSMARVGRPGVRVLPKVRTPAGGISLRSLSRYACVRGPGVDAVWHKVPAQRPDHDPRRRPANVLLLPWPLRIRARDFRPRAGSIQREGREPFGFFEFAPDDGLDLELLDGVLRAALEEVDVVDMVVLPESAVPVDAIDDVEAVLARHGVGLLVAGVREPADIDRQPGNWVTIGVRLGGRWWHYRQNKHHRWSLEETQVRQYHLGGALHPSLRWWESMEVPRRAVQFVEIGGGITIVAVICEDLARLDAVADLLRTVGPTLVLTVLLDGPQLASRWTARYASVLADDPGSAVLTLTAFGMVERSLPAGFAPSRVVALWKDPTGGIREVSLEPGAQGVLLSMSVDRATRHTADSRWPADDTTQLRDAGVRQIRATAPPDEAALAHGSHRPRCGRRARRVRAHGAGVLGRGRCRGRYPGRARRGRGRRRGGRGLARRAGPGSAVTSARRGDRAAVRRWRGPGPGHAARQRVRRARGTGAAIGERPIWPARRRADRSLTFASWRTSRRSTTPSRPSRRSAPCSATPSSRPPSPRSSPSATRSACAPPPSNAASSRSCSPTSSTSPCCRRPSTPRTCATSSTPTSCAGTAASRPTVAWSRSSSATP